MSGDALRAAVSEIEARRRVADGVVRKMLGHEQASTTLNRYTHVERDDEQRVLNSFGSDHLPPTMLPEDAADSDTEAENASRACGSQ